MNMGMVREPEGVDFLVKSKSPTKEELALMSAHILAYTQKSASEESSRRVARKTSSDKT